MAKRTTINTFKASIGVVVLLGVAAIALVAAISTLSTILNPNNTTRLQRFAAGHDQVVVTLTKPNVRIAFPIEPKASTETVHLFSLAVTAERRIGPVGDDAAELLWFKVPPKMSRDNLLSTLGIFEAADLGGSVHEATTQSQTPPFSYQFRVPARVGQKSDYFVRIMIDRGIVFVFRIRAKSDGVKALEYFAHSYCVIGKTCGTKA